MISGNLAEEALSILALSPWWKTENIWLQLSLKEEGETSLCLLILLKLVNLKYGMGFFFLSNSAEGC